MYDSDSGTDWRFKMPIVKRHIVHWYQREMENHNDGTNTKHISFPSQKDKYLKNVRDIRNNGREIINILAREKP